MEQKRETKKAKSKALNKKSDPNINTMKSKKPISDPKATLSLKDSFNEICLSKGFVTVTRQ